MLHWLVLLKLWERKKKEKKKNPAAPDTVDLIRVRNLNTSFAITAWPPTRKQSLTFTEWGAEISFLSVNVA